MLAEEKTSKRKIVIRVMVILALIGGVLLFRSFFNTREEVVTKSSSADEMLLLRHLDLTYSQDVHVEQLTYYPHLQDPGFIAIISIDKEQTETYLSSQTSYTKQADYKSSKNQEIQQGHSSYFPISKWNNDSSGCYFYVYDMGEDTLLYCHFEHHTQELFDMINRNK